MKSIAAKLVKIMGACDYVQKDGKNSFHNYKYVSAANILEKVNAACVKQNVASVTCAEIVGEKEKPNKSGNMEYLVTVKLTLTLVDGDSGEALTIVSLGTGQDAGDKAVAKAQTMALKYAWMSTLNISTGDDPEADESVDERNHGKVTAQAKTQPAPSPKITPAPAAKQKPQLTQTNISLASEPQRKKLYAMIKDLAWTPDEAKGFIEAETGKGSSKDLAMDEIQNIFVKLQGLIDAREQAQWDELDKLETSSPAV